jgi:DNA-binding Xre family transcriptional regulator
MTSKHLLEGVMQSTRARSHHHCSKLLGLDVATISRLSAGKVVGMHIRTLDQIQQITGIPIETLFAWYRLPDGAHLGRIAAVGQAQAGREGAQS